MPERGMLTQVTDEVEAGASANQAYFLLAALSCVLATLGLITNSVAVIIGAMLVAPLMGPIMGLSLASIHQRDGLYRRSAITLLSGIAMAVALSAVIAAGARQLPFDALAVVPSEVATRAQPSFFDLGVALSGGAAGAYAMARLKGAAAVIGVAIATALMPPLCSVGIGIALTDGEIVRGAFLLFLTNFVAITFAALTVFVALGFRSSGAAWPLLQAVLVASGVVFLGVLLSALTLRTVNDARAEGRVRRAVDGALADVLPGSELLSLSRTTSGETLRLRIRVQVADSASRADVRLIQERMADELRRSVELTFVGVPTLELDAVQPAFQRSPTTSPTAVPTHSPTRVPTPTSVPPSATPTQSQPTPPLTGNAPPNR